MVSGSDGIGLRQAVAAVRAELIEAMNDGVDSALRFEIGPVELDFAIDVSTTATGEVGVRVWVLSLAGKGERAVRNSHRVTVTLNPVDPSDGMRARIADRVISQPPRPGLPAE
jgi:hypothetical protein